MCCGLGHGSRSRQESIKKKTHERFATGRIGFGMVIEKAAVAVNALPSNRCLSRC